MKSVFKSKIVERKFKLVLYKAMLIPVEMYGSFDAYQNQEEKILNKDFCTKKNGRWGRSRKYKRNQTLCYVLIKRRLDDWDVSSDGSRKAMYVRLEGGRKMKLQPRKRWMTVIWKAQVRHELQRQRISKCWL